MTEVDPRSLRIKESKELSYNKFQFLTKTSSIIIYKYVFINISTVYLKILFNNIAEVQLGADQI